MAPERQGSHRFEARRADPRGELPKMAVVRADPTAISGSSAG